MSSSVLPASGTFSRHESTTPQVCRKTGFSLWGVGAGAALPGSTWRVEPLLYPVLQQACSLPSTVTGQVLRSLFFNSLLPATTRRSSRSHNLRKFPTDLTRACQGQRSSCWRLLFVTSVTDVIQLQDGSLATGFIMFMKRIYFSLRAGRLCWGSCN